MSKLDMNRVISNFQQRSALIHANLHSSEEVATDIHRVVVSFSSRNGDALERKLAIAKLFDGFAAPIDKSFREIAGHYNYTAVGYIAANPETREFTDEVVASGRYKTVASNIMMDMEDETLWQLSSSADAKYLTRHGEEDLGELVALASLKTKTAFGRNVDINSVVISSIGEGEYVSFVNPNTMEVSYGYSLGYETATYANEEGEEVEKDELLILDRESNDVINIDPHLVVESAVMNGDDAEGLPEEITAAFDDASQSKEGMKEYYKAMLGYSPEYFAMMEQIIETHAVV